jgi:hypothetical protein
MCGYIHSPYSTSDVNASICSYVSEVNEPVLSHTVLYLNKNNIKSDRREEDQERLKTMERI